MPLIIDGWNFIRNRKSDIRDDDDDALDSASELILRLAEFQKTRRDPVMLVFDSSSGFLDIGFKNTPNLSIVAAKSADDYIKRHIDSVPEKQRRNIRVVSSDNDVYYYARSSGATPLKCEEFWDKLRRRVS